MIDSIISISSLKEFLDSQDWVNAKSYEASYPHYYLNKNKSTDKDTFVKVIEYIRLIGMSKSFYSKQYIYLEIDGYEYWDMGRPSLTTIILNKAKINDNAKYRNPKPTLLQHQILKDKLIFRDEYLNTLLNKELKTDSEIKQIKFLLDTKRRIEGGGKNIIDNYKQTVIYE